MDSKLERIRGNVKVIAGVSTGNKDLTESGHAEVRSAARGEKAAHMKKSLDDAFDSVADRVEKGLEPEHGGTNVK